MVTTNLIRKALDRLDAQDRILLEQSFLDNEPEIDIMRRYGMTRKEVRTGIRTALERLRTVLRVHGVTTISDVL